jgi:hypothetical protein
MPEAVSSVLTPWANFYILTGSAAAGLTGLMFVVITLVTGSERVRRNPDGISTFSTPTVVHLGVALLASAILSTPWHALVYPAVLLGVAGLSGVVYVLRILRRSRNLAEYALDIEDWAWYAVLPLAAYGAILGGAVPLCSVPSGALFAIAGGVTLLIFIGIHNAWDIVTYLAIGGGAEPPSE